MNNLVDKIFIINLPSRPQRWLECTRELKKLGWTNVERVDACVPTQEQVVQHHPNPKSKYARGVVGCKLSHLKVVQRAKECGYQRILILEDDFEWVSSRDVLDQALGRLQEIDGWGLAYLSSNNLKKGVCFGDDVWFRCVQSLTTAAYIVDASVYDLILQAFSYRVEIDTYYVQHVQPVVFCIAVHPNLFIQRSGYSDIKQEEEVYELVDIMDDQLS